MRIFKYQDSSNYSALEAFDHFTFLDDIRAIPLVVACFFTLVQVSRILVDHVRCLRRQNSTIQSGVGGARGFKAHVQHLGGYTIYGFMILRLLGATSLLVLSAVTASKCRAAECPERLLSLTYLSSALLALISLISKRRSTSATRYNILILLSAFAVYSYRDLWPLATYTQRPADLEEGRILWVKIALLAFTSIGIPLFVPRRYVPVDPKDPMTKPNPEQTASIFSMMTYTYLDAIIFSAYKVPHLPVDQLPPLADFDSSKYQTEKAFPHLDIFSGAKRRHMFWGLMRVFGWEYVTLTITAIGYALGGFVSPIGIYQVLKYLETGSASANTRPWLWIIWLLAGPLIVSLCSQYYLFLNTKVFVRTEGLLTQLIFEHSLRIRLKAETSNAAEGIQVETKASSSSVAASEATADDDASMGEPSATDSKRREASETATLVVSREASSSTSSSTETTRKVQSPEPPKPAPRKSSENLIGKINNLITTDLNYIVEGQDFLMIVLYVPLQITLCLVFLYRLLGWSAFVGFGLTVVLLPLPVFVTKILQGTQIEKMKKTDARVQAVTEAVNVVRMVKLFGWEKKMTSQLHDKREEELKSLRKVKVYDNFNGIIGGCLPIITMLTTYGFYTIVLQGDLTASKIFSSMTVFSMLREQLIRLLRQTGLIIQAKVSLDRVDDFLKNTELLDSFAESVNSDASNLRSPIIIEPLLDIGFRNATFSWSTDTDDGYSTPSGRNFKLHIDGELLFKRNGLNMIIGPTGSGKTSMLMALLGEMHFMSSSPDSAFHLPRSGGVAYAAQESWVENKTIRNNILFGSEYDEVRYKKVIKQCALEQDLELFEAGDSTEIGERGLTLSGGQKARVTLARAIYSRAEIILLDDILAALDVHTATWLVNNCFLGDLVKDRTILLVTHNIALVGPIADFIVAIGADGTVKTQSVDLALALARDPVLALEVDEDKETTQAKKEDDSPPAAAANGKLILTEEVAQGHVTWKSIRLLLSGLGGSSPILFFVIVMASIIWNELAMTLQVWYIGYWGSQYENHPASEVNATKYLTIYTLFVCFCVTQWSSVYLYYQYGTLRASKVIHDKLVDSVFGSTLRWLDATPTGRIIARCTQDIRAIDGPVPLMLLWGFDRCIGILTKLGAIVLFTPAFLVPGLLAACVGLWIGNVYLKAQLSVKRETSNARSPLLSHFSAAFHGLVSIRAYGAQANFKSDSLTRIDHYTRVARLSWNLNQWIAVRMDVIGATFTAALATYLIYGPPVGASNTGFSLSVAVEFTTTILILVRIYNIFEVESNSLERIQAYMDIDHEPKPTDAGVPPAAWPTSGELRVEKLSARYSPSSPEILHDISFSVASGERLGIVGRTGSGKSSLTLALLRCILTEGEVYYDGILTTSVNLDALRSSLTIIPQIPELLSGTLRQNLDPFGQHDDAILNDALRAAGLFTLQEEGGEASISLDTKIAGGGSNLSVGQRQIIAIARAMLRGSKLLILDEATSAIDYKTDIVIQNALRTQLGSDVTVITIAHRLQSVMDADKIMVLDSGRIAEFGRPRDLLKTEEGILRGLVDGSGDADTLFELAGVHENSG